MFEVALTVLYAVFLWWFSTGAILYLDRLAPSTYRWSMLGATALLLAALAGIASTASGSAGATDAFTAFSCGLLIWGWHEMSFLMGHITGPRACACPSGARGLARFLFAAQTVIYHEIAILVTIAAAAYLTKGLPNQVGLETLLVLWGMRLSTKFNLFLGVPRHHAEMLPTHLAYLQTYFRERPMNGLFPVSVTAATLLTILLFQRAIAPAATPLEVAGCALLATLSGLALLEHWFLVVPLPDEALWAWAKPPAGPLTLAIDPAPSAVKVLAR